MTTEKERLVTLDRLESQQKEIRELLDNIIKKLEDKDGNAETKE